METMQWLLTVGCLLSLIASFAAITVARSYREEIRGISARLASISGEMSQWERTERLTPSSLAELAAVKDAIDKGNELLKRISQREVMRERRNGGLPLNPSKDDLRRAAGLVAGKPAPHQ